MKLDKRFDKQFDEVVRMIHEAQFNAIKNVNAELVNLYWNVGKYISKKLVAAEWGDAVIDHLADYIQNKHPGYKGFTRRGLYRMRQFYEAYRGDKIVSPLVTQISWTNHLIILSKTKTIEGCSYRPPPNIKTHLLKILRLYSGQVFTAPNEIKDFGRGKPPQRKINSIYLSQSLQRRISRAKSK
jgi:hypothetical protein